MLNKYFVEMLQKFNSIVCEMNTNLIFQPMINKQSHKHSILCDHQGSLWNQIFS